MSYILNSLEDIEKVFVPNIEYLNDSFYNFIRGFPKSEEAIKNSMKFFEYNYYGEEYERFSISYKQFNHKRSDHKYLGVDYQKLQININLEVFLEELEKKINQEREIFYNDIKECEGTKPNFIINLRKHLDSLYTSISFIENKENTEIELEKIILDTYLKSYKTYIQVLKREYKTIYPTAFKTEQMVWDWSGYNKPIKHTNVPIGKNILTNPIETILRDRLLSKNTTPENITKIETINPFPKDELKQVLDNNLKDDLINKFYEKETDLFKQGYFKEGKWNKSKKNLIVFCKVIAENSYIQKRYSGKKLLHIFKFFEKRYNIKIGDQRKPCNHKQIEIDENDFADFKSK